MRRLHLAFGVGGTGMEDVVGGFGGTLPVNSIDGVGRRFSSVLNAAGVRTLDDLITVNPLQPIRPISGVKLLEFRAKARTGWSISRFLQEEPEVIVAEVPGVMTSRVIKLQETLAVLQVALDDAALREISLGTLLSS